MQKKVKTAIQPTRKDNFPEWYQSIIKESELAQNSQVRGCMIIRPNGFSIWENIQEILNKKLKDTGHQNAYFPLLIPLSYLEKEAGHVEGFAKECAVVTHHRLEQVDNQLIPAGKLDEPYIIRPTSETIIAESFSNWVNSYRDLPLKINQWANVMRWEMRTRLFLRTSEFLWQEGHTAHETKQEAIEETRLILKIYKELLEEYLAIPVLDGLKTPDEKFPGAEETYTVETLMQDNKAVQSGTSHFLGQNFSKVFNIKFQSRESIEEFAWTTSWGVSTRLIGALIMSHSDDNGLVLPPKIAPIKVLIIPILPKNADQDEILKACDNLKVAVEEKSYCNSPIKCFVDNSDKRGGEKLWGGVKKGYPVIVEIGPKDIENESVCYRRRDEDPQNKNFVTQSEFCINAENLLIDIQNNLFSKAKKRLDENSSKVSSIANFKKFFENNGGFAYAYWNPKAIGLDLFKELKVTPRCIIENEVSGEICIFTNEPAQALVAFARSY